MKGFCSFETKGKFYLAAGLVAAGVLLSSLDAIHAAENITIGMASRNFSFLTFQVAEEKGFYKKHDLRVEPVLMRSDVAIAALSSGNVDYITHFNGVIRATLVGFDMRVIFTTAHKQMFSLVVQPDIRSVQDLKGKSVAITSIGGFQHSITVRLLKSAGINPDKEVQWILANESVAMQQLKAKQLHAVLLNPPLSIVLQNEGFPLLLHAADSVEAPLTGLGATTARIREKPEQVKKLLRALYEAQQYVKNRKKETVELSARWLKMDPKTAANTYDLAINTLSPDGTASDKGIAASIEILKEGTKLTSNASPGDVADFSPLREVIKEYAKKER